MCSSRSTLIRRLHRCERGLASMEFVLGLPVMLLMVLALQHAHMLVRSRQEMVVGTRSAAWNEARNGACVAAMELAVGARRFAQATAPRCQTVNDANPGGADAFWSEAERAASWSRGRLTADVRGAEQTEWVRAEARVQYGVTDLSPGWLRNPSPAWSTVMEDSYVVPRARFWTYYDAALRYGYNRVIKRALGRTFQLFPGLLGR